MKTDTSEKGLESLIVAAMTGHAADAPVQPARVALRPSTYGGTGWILGRWQDYDREYAVDLAQLAGFLNATQREVAEALDLDHDGPTRQKFLARLQGEITKRGVIDVLRHGVRHGPHDLDLFYGTPTPGNSKAEERYTQNRFSVTRQLCYSRDETQLALDLCLFINGLPVATFELKNSLTKQTVEDAIEQYRRDRDPRELLFQFGRCVAHFAVDDHEVRFCTYLKGKGSWFLPFNQGYNDGAGNPPNPDDIKRARKKLRRYVESHDHAIWLKAEIMVDHFHEQVLALHKIGGQARAMVVTSGIERAIQYFHAIGDYLKERKSPYRAIVAFSGEHEYGGAPVTEASLNGFPSNAIADRIVEDPYRFLICADKFQTGYDEPLLHTMYVDKVLSGVKAVQTLSRLNRAHPQKHDAFVLDFMNDADTIEKAFEDYYRTTILSEETDPNKLHDLKAALDGY